MVVLIIPMLLQALVEEPIEQLHFQMLVVGLQLVVMGAIPASVEIYSLYI